MQKKWGAGWQTGTPQKTAVVLRPIISIILIIHIYIELKEIHEKGRDFPWEKPDLCPQCRSARLWGHGYVLAFFDGFIMGTYLKRYRCPDCGCVIRMKPMGYFNRFQASVHTIRSNLAARIKTGRWPPDKLSNSRKRHWLKALKRKAAAFFGINADLITAFDRLMKMGRIPVARSI